MTRVKAEAVGWRTGQRVSREDSNELGTIVEADGDIKVKWDSGRTSYFRRDAPSNVKLEEPKA
jgi:hypothetical protein